MTIIRIGQAGQFGVNKDLSQHELRSRRRLKLVSGLLRFAVGGVSVFLGLKRPNVAALAIHADDGSPRVLRFMPTDSGVARCVASFKAAVLMILGMRTLAEICKSVVPGIAVDVVNASVRPSPMNVKPSQSVGFVPNAVNPDGFVAKAVGFKSFLANVARLPMLFPDKCAVFGAVPKQFKQTSVGNVTVHFQPLFVEALCDRCMAVDTEYRRSGATLAMQGAF